MQRFGGSVCIISWVYNVFELLSDKMFAQFKAHLQWRTEFGVDAILDEDFSGTHDQENLCCRDCCFLSICVPALLSSDTTQENKISANVCLVS
jgi:hypothetical protein